MDKLSVKSVEEEWTITRASVTPSERLTNDKHQFWIVFKSDRSVITSFCTCTAWHAAVQLMSNGPYLNFKEFETEKKNSIPCDTCNIYICTLGMQWVTKVTDISKNFVCIPRILNWIIQILHYYYKKQHKNIENSQIIEQNLVVSLPFSLFTVACAVYSGKLRRILNVTSDHSWNI